MKKILVILTATVLGATLASAQGLVSISSGTAAIAYTNGPTFGKATGTGNYFYELLVASSLSMPGSASNITSAANLVLWKDTGVIGGAGTGLSAGRITGGTSVAATGWTAPGAVYDNPMSYMIVGWSSSYGSTWGSVSNLIATTGLTAGGYFGTTIIGLNFAGGGSVPLNAVTLWNNQTGTLGYGITAVNNASSLTMNLVTGAVPEPSTLALAALGGASLLLFRRRK